MMMKEGKIYRIEPGVPAALADDLDSIAADLTTALQALNRASDKSFDLFAKSKAASQETREAGKEEDVQ